PVSLRVPLRPRPHIPPSAFFFFPATAPTHTYTLSLHDALPISHQRHQRRHVDHRSATRRDERRDAVPAAQPHALQVDGHDAVPRSEEHTSELQSLAYLVCRLLLEKKKNTLDCHTDHVIAHTTPH